MAEVLMQGKENIRGVFYLKAKSPAQVEAVRVLLRSIPDNVGLAEYGDRMYDRTVVPRYLDFYTTQVISLILTF